MNASHSVRRPNILVVVADDHRADCLGGDRRSGPATPTLDELAARGTRLTGVRIVGGHNAAVCVPSRASLLTGRAPHRALVRPKAPTIAENQRIRPECALLGEPFRAAGYESVAIGKWHNDKAALNRSFETGCELFLEGMSDHRELRLHDYDPSGRYRVADAHRSRGFSTDVFTEAASRFIRSRNAKAAPFLLYLALTSPHDPRTPPPAFRRRYCSRDVVLPGNFAARHPFDNGELRVRDELLAPIPRRRNVVRRHLADYYAMIEHHDHHLGRVVDALAEIGQLANTIIVYLSDHGLALGSHGLMGKQNVYEHSLRVPFIIAGPGIATGRSVNSDRAASGLFATLCELAGVSRPPSVEAESFAPLLVADVASPASGPARDFFSHYRDVQRAVKRGEWKLIRYEVSGKTRHQLFNTKSDPGETDDRWGEPALAPIAAALSARLEQWWSGQVETEVDCRL